MNIDQHLKLKLWYEKSGTRVSKDDMLHELKWGLAFKENGITLTVSRTIFENISPMFPKIFSPIFSNVNFFDQKSISTVA